MNSKNKHIIELDAVRAIAALSVMLLHFIPSLSSENSIVIYLKKYHSIFQFGVPIFFVLSGFLISRILFKSKNDVYRDKTNEMAMNEHKYLNTLAHVH